MTTVNTTSATTPPATQKPITAKYPFLSRAIHWLMAVLIIFLLALGFYMSDFLPKDSESRFAIYHFHKSLGVIALIFIIIRIINRLASKVPPLPDTMPKYEVILSKLAHFALYILMLVMPISGYLMSNYFGFPVILFKYPMPFLVEKNFELGNLFAKTHGIAAYTLVTILFLHILAVIKHRLFDKPEHDVLKRMW
jgi:cytochrome b561